MLLLFLCFVCVQDEEPVLPWNASYKLSWADFKDKPNMNESAVAITASGITFGFSITQTDKNEVVSFTTEVFAHFYPEQSWYKIKQADNHILGHEQLHFDITELYARKFRYRISQLKVSNNVRRQLKKMHNDINVELAQMQDKYDNETDYSRNFEYQTTWKIYIDTELKKYSKYKSTSK
ncbi:DUF922 domain-containing protein [uncultured Algibacter sp.]|uniref:DUF922 domain-containing protein n=1 Tax=uncultured Algibacter sp. TaxID=298659 RepID=UPI0026080AD5|nr:DUF922 domain-containing protein [uncultured Algibacter sp.]